jgi:Fe-S-cluster-containing dehydrogenase component
VEKCDFCVKRLARGQLPACVETCPSKVRVFGDLNDSKSKLAELISGREYRLKKPEAGTGPQIYYLL